MSIELLKKSLDLVSAGEGLPSTSAGLGGEKKSRRKRNKNEQKSIFDQDFTEPPKVFVKRSRALVRSRLELHQEQPKRDFVARNVAVLRAADKKAALPKDHLKRILRHTAAKDVSRARSAARVKALMEAGEDWLNPRPKRKKKKVEKSLVLDDKDFKDEDPSLF